MSAENKQIAEKFTDEIFNKGNLEGVSRFVTPDFVYHGQGEASLLTIKQSQHPRLC